MTQKKTPLDPQDIRVMESAMASCLRKSRAALEGPLDPPAEAPWAEVERRVCASPAADPGAVAIPRKDIPGLTLRHVRSMVSAAYSRHVLVDRSPREGLSCYKVYSPANPELLHGQDESDVEYEETASMALYVSTTPAGYSLEVEYMSSTPGSTARTHTVTSPTVSGACRAALAWAHAGRPVPATRKPPEAPRVLPPPQVAVPEEQQYLADPSQEYSRIRRALGWLLRWVVSYAVASLYLLAVLGAAAHMWLTGVVVLDEILVMVKGLVWAAVSGTAIKYAGVYAMSGLAGVSQELQDD